MIKFRISLILNYQMNKQTTKEALGTTASSLELVPSCFAKVDTILLGNQVGLETQYNHVVGDSGTTG